MDPLIVRDPVYQQLNQRLRVLAIRDYGPGQKFLTEREIVRRYSVSRATANKALSSLVSEGLLEFRKGVGTFVRRPAITYDLRSLVSFTKKARAAGKVPATSLLTFGLLKAAEVDPEVVAMLRVQPSERIWELDRLRSIDGVPVILEHRLVVESLCPSLTRTQVQGSLYQTWTESHGLAIAGADEVVRVVLLTNEEAVHWQSARMRSRSTFAFSSATTSLPFWVVMPASV